MPHRRPVLPSSDPVPLPVAEFQQMRRRIPWLYALLVVNAAAVSYTHRGLAPSLLTDGLPFALALTAVWRMASWMMPPPPDQIRDRAAPILRRTFAIGIAVALAFACWAISLDWFADSAHSGQIAVFLAITLLGCMFGLMHVPRVAGAVAFASMAPFMAYAILRGNPPLIAIAGNIALVAAVVTKLLADAHADFAALIDSREALRSERRQASQLSDENRLLAQTDPLTGLPNRRFFFARLETLLQEGEPFCVGVLDLDRFKPVNDNYGHIAGDQLLSTIGQRLSALCDERLVIARLGGDEFGLLAVGDSMAASARVAALCGPVSAAVPFQDAALRVGCSIGLSAYPQAGNSAHELFDRADYALCHAKQHQRGECVLFSHEHEAIIRDEARLENALRGADLANELHLVFQPIFEARSVTLTGVEALARWASPILGPIPADRLIATAERTGMINRVTLTLFSKALTMMRLLPDDLRLSFNLSAYDIASPATVRELTRQIVAAGVKPDRLTFEITETALMSDMAIAREVLSHFRALGVKIALDDFGTGYSSLGILSQLPLDTLKIDRAFAAGMSTAAGRAMVSAIRNLAQSLSLECVMEGIENESQLIEVTLLGYHYAQGYLLGRPADAETLLQSIDRSKGPTLPKTADGVALPAPGVLRRGQA